MKYIVVMIEPGLFEVGIGNDNYVVKTHIIRHAGQRGWLTYLVETGENIDAHEAVTDAIEEICAGSFRLIDMPRVH